jgi:hypothetical protein
LSSEQDLHHRHPFSAFRNPQSQIRNLQSVYFPL